MIDSKPILAGRTLHGGASSRLVIDGTEFINFGGCNYLALSQRSELRDAARTALDNHCLFSRFLHSDYGGDDPSFDRVQREAAKFWGTESAIYLPSGYHLGFAAFAALKPLFDVIVLDEQAHWCLFDAAKVDGAPVVTFRHCNAEALTQVLHDLPQGCRPLIATDGSFATTGRLPPLDRYAALLSTYNGQLLVDESHSAGVLGKTGRGTLQHFRLTHRVHFAATLSKAFCGHGAIFAGTSEMIARANGSPAIRGSNQGSPVSAEVSAAALQLVRQNPQFCAKVRSNAAKLRAALQNLGLDIIDTPMPIVSFSFGTWRDLGNLQRALFNRGIYVLHSNYIAAGPAGTIRLAVFRDHTADDLGRVTDAIAILIR